MGMWMAVDGCGWMARLVQRRGHHSGYAALAPPSPATFPRVESALLGLGALALLGVISHLPALLRDRQKNG